VIDARKCSRQTRSSTQDAARRLDVVLHPGSGAWAELPIQQINRTPCGWWDRGRFHRAICFHLGELDFYPNVPDSAHTKA